jgi:hypothetical protein
VNGVAEVGRGRGGSTEPAGGAEVTWAASRTVTVVGRVGAWRVDGADAVSPLTFGGGLRTAHFGLDYAYEGFESFGASHRVGARWWR